MVQRASLRRPDFAGRFARVDVPEMKQGDTLETLEVAGENLEKNLKVKTAPGVFREVVKFSDRFVHRKVFPEKAFDQMRETAALGNGKKTIKVKDIWTHFAEFT